MVISLTYQAFDPAHREDLTPLSRTSLPIEIIRETKIYADLVLNFGFSFFLWILIRMATT